MSGLEAIAMMALKELQGKEQPQEKRDEAVPSPAVVSNSSQEDDASIHRQQDADRATRALPFERTEGDPQSAPDNVVVEQANFSAIIADPTAWLKETEPYFTDTFASKIDPKFGVIESVQTNDVLCGRGGETNHHSGNIAYRALVKAFRPLYVQSTRRSKPKIAQCIVYSVRQAGGRFLKRVDSKKGNGEEANAAGGGWVDVGNFKAREKTSQALREGAPDLRHAGDGTAGTHELPMSPARVVSTNSTGFPSSMPSDAARPSPALPPFAGGHPSPSMMAFSQKPPNRLHAAALARQSSGSGPSSFTRHPMYNSLSPYDQQQHVLDELQAARKAVTSAEMAAFRHYQYQRQHHRQQHFENERRVVPGFGSMPKGQYDYPHPALSGNDFVNSPHGTQLQRKKAFVVESDWPRPVTSFSSPLPVHSEGKVNKRPAPAAVLSMPMPQTDDGKSKGNAGDDGDKSKRESRGPRTKRFKQRMQQDAAP